MVNVTRRSLRRRKPTLDVVATLDDEGKPVVPRKRHLETAWDARKHPADGQKQRTIYRLVASGHVRKGSLGPAEMQRRGKAARRLLAAQAAFASKGR